MHTCLVKTALLNHLGRGDGVKQLFTMNQLQPSVSISISMKTNTRTPLFSDPYLGGEGGFRRRRRLSAHHPHVNSRQRKQHENLELLKVNPGTPTG